MADLYDMDGEGGTLEDLVREHLGPAVDDYDVEAVTADYREAVNARRSDTGMSLDENSDVIADGFIDDNPRELLDDAVFNTKLSSIIDLHRP
ncbi:hypothetical protein AB0E59_42275 [Lentzea sp. NPDC034063]|uniref:hypothetical protein n=1 Tax=unclassified Lentzea TaxID=2643253 RepID=UPI0033EDB228